jgi:hypothetical protein
MDAQIYVVVSGGVYRRHGAKVNLLCRVRVDEIGE